MCKLKVDLGMVDLRSTMRLRGSSATLSVYAINRLASQIHHVITSTSRKLSYPTTRASFPIEREDGR